MQQSMISEHVSRSRNRGDTWRFMVGLEGSAPGLFTDHCPSCWAAAAMLYCCMSIWCWCCCWCCCSMKDANCCCCCCCWLLAVFPVTLLAPEAFCISETQVHCSGLHELSKYQQHSLNECMLKAIYSL